MIIAILDYDGVLVVKYEYDAWGNHKVVDLSGEEITDENNIGHINPFRYRSYYYDREFGLYYLKTRYYDPTTGRFVNMDDTAYINPDIINGLNIYAYCANNPVMNVDFTGEIPLPVLWGISFGAGVGTGLAASAMGQFIAGGFTWDDFSWEQFAIDGVLGGASGLLSMSPFGAKTMIIANAGISFVGSVSGHLIRESDFLKQSTIMDIIFSTAFGAFVGKIGGAGALHVNTLKKVQKTTGFINAAGVYDDVLTKVVTESYMVTENILNELKVAGQTLVKEWNKMIANEAGKALSKALQLSAKVTMIGTSAKSLLGKLYDIIF